MSIMMSSSPRKPIALMRRDELIEHAQQLQHERDHHKESVRCMSIVFDDLAKIVGINSGDVDGLLEHVAALAKMKGNA